MDIFKKYDVAGPRYTSFPPVPFWNNSPKPRQWLDSIRLSYDPKKGIDIYIHIPFCEKLCWYCGCFRTISKDKSKGDVYTDYLLKEWEIYHESLKDLDLKIHSIHFGGGTPTFLKPESLENLLSHFAPHLSDNFIGAMEVDPRTCSADHLKVLKNFGFKRISMGIQDFNSDVQKAINREQSFKMVSDLVKSVRESEFTSINFDLIYGLPLQTNESIKDTIEKVNRLSPDLIAFYSYAHLPDRLKNQKLIKECDLPSGQEKRELYELGKGLLLSTGYIEIGLDHFAKKDSYLGKCYLDKKMQRSFMGYTDEKTTILLALGVSSISNTPDCYIQNEKELNSYMKALDNGGLPILKGHILTNADKSASKMINELMCTSEVMIDELESSKYRDLVLDELAQMQNDGLIDFNGNKVKMTQRGQPFLRNVAMSFDFYLREQKDKVRFSRTI